MEATRGTTGGEGRIELRGVSKRFGSVAALSGVDLTIVPGEVHALVGENGAGKTTLLSLLSGSNRPDTGELLVDGHPVGLASPADALRLGIGTVHQHPTLVPTLTVRENLLLGDEGAFRLGRRDSGGRRKDETDLPLGELVGGLAVGARQRVEIARALRRGHRALLLDEPTAVLAPEEIDALLGLIRELAAAGRAVVLVTHRLDEALAVSDRVTVLRAGRVVATEAVGGDREELRGRIVAAMFLEGDGETGRRVDEERGRRREGRVEGRMVLEVEGITARDDRGAVALDGLSLRLMAGEILGLAGVEGNGQRELAEVIAGQRRPTGGSIRLDGEDVTSLSVAGRLAVGIGMLTDERLGEGVVPGTSVALTLAMKRLTRAPFSSGLRLDRRAIRHRATALISDHDIRPANPDRDVATLSGGNIQKVLVARELAANPRVLVASKPLAGLDLRTAERILGLLRGHAAGGAAVLLISSDLPELLAASDRIAVAYRGRIAGVVERAEFDPEAIGRAMLTGRVA